MDWTPSRRCWSPMSRSTSAGCIAGSRPIGRNPFRTGRTSAPCCGPGKIHPGPGPSKTGGRSFEMRTALHRENRSGGCFFVFRRESDRELKGGPALELHSAAGLLRCQPVGSQTSGGGDSPGGGAIEKRQAEPASLQSFYSTESGFFRSLRRWRNLRISTVSPITVKYNT